MMRIPVISSMLFLIFCSTILTACENDIGEIENQNYATAIGVDYRDGEYYVYIQMLGLSSVARNESGKKAPVEVYVSETKGKTFIDGFFKAYYTSQERFIWAHVTAIVLSENVLKTGVSNVFDGLTRYYEFRPTPWIFGTKESIEKVLSATGFFRQPPLKTILHSPENSYEQSSTIKPVRLNQFFREFFEPGRTAYIPSLSINDTQWEKKNKEERKLEIDGAFFLNNQRYKSYFPYEKIKGIRWLSSENKRSSILLPGGEKPEILTVLEDQKVKIRTKKNNGNFCFTISYFANGIVSNRIENNTMNVKAMEEFVKEEIISEVRELYLLGLKHDIDFLNLEHKIYRHYHSDWKQLKDQDSLLHEDSLKSIEAHITLKHAGAFKNRKITVTD